MSEIITVQDLETLKKHEIFESEVLTGKVGGLATGANIDYATNAVTGQVQKTLPAILRDLGFEPASFDFTTGGTLGVNDRDKAVLWPLAGGGDGFWYNWEGALPKVIPAASTPYTTGGVADGAWRPVGDISLRAELAEDTGFVMIGTPSGTLKDTLAARWANSGADKKEIVFELPLLFPDYNAILAAHPTWTYIYPGAFTRGDDGKIYIQYGPNSSAAVERFVVVYSATGTYLGYYQTNSGALNSGNFAFAAEGVVVTSYYGGTRLFVGDAFGSILEYDITSAPYGSTLTLMSSHQVGLYNQFAFLNGVWAVEQAPPSSGHWVQRDVIAYFNSSFVMMGHTQLSMQDSGYVSVNVNDYGSRMTKRQGLALAPGVLLGGYGGVFISASTVEAPTNYQGVKAFAADGSKMVEALSSPSKFIAKLIADGRPSTRIENEGICYYGGDVFTLWINTDRAQPNAHTGGVLITKEFSMTPNLDLSGAVVVPPGYSHEKIATGVFPRTLDGTVLTNPITGTVMTSMVDVLDFMQYAGQKKVMIYTSSTPLLDLNGVAIPSATTVTLTTLNNFTFDIETTSTEKVKRYRIRFVDNDYIQELALGHESRFIRIAGTDDAGTLTFNRILGRTRGNTADVDANQILIIDQQNNSAGASTLTIGGGSSVYRSTTAIQFATNPTMTATGGTIRWRMDDVTFRPFADNLYWLGTAGNRVKEIFAAIGAINTSDGREKTEPLDITDTVLDAWGDVNIITFQWLESIRLKGDDARWHFGVIAQQVRDAFIAHGLDGCDYGLLCYDEWGDQFEPVIEIRENQETGKTEEHHSGEMKLVIEKGNRWGIRPDQCLFLEAAYQRRRCDRIEARLATAGL